MAKKRKDIEKVRKDVWVCVNVIRPAYDKKGKEEKYVSIVRVMYISLVGLSLQILNTKYNIVNGYHVSQGVCMWRISKSMYLHQNIYVIS